MNEKMIEKKIDDFIEKQRKQATGQRLEMLNRDLRGTRKLLALLYSVLKTFDGLVLEYEMVSNTGVRIYVDIFYVPLGIGFEAEGYVVHEEKLTRERFSFERMRIRSIGNRRLTFYPFSWDEMDKQPEACRRDIYELIGSRGSVSGTRLLELPVYEREVLRFAVVQFETFGMAEVQNLLLLTYKPSRNIVTELIQKGYLLQKGGGTRRRFQFEISSSGRELFIG